MVLVVGVDAYFGSASYCYCYYVCYWIVNGDQMNLIKLLMIAALFVGCATQSTKAPDIYDGIQPGQAIAEHKEFPEPYYLLAWGTKHPDWDSALLKATKALDWSGVEMPCKKVPAYQCAAQTLSIAAKYESGFDPSVKYAESGDLAGVTSRGLLQISIVSSRSYNCGFANEQEIHQPIKNLECGVKILHRWSKEYGVMLNGDKYSGLGRYWAVGRKYKGSELRKSFKEITKYMEKF